MKTFLILNLFIFAFSAHAFNKTMRMNNLLEENGVPAKGNRQSRAAYITCRIPKNEPSLTCSLHAGYSFIASRNISIEFQGEKAIEISELLEEFGAEAKGKRQRQDLEVECKLKGKRTNCIRLNDFAGDHGVGIH